MEENTEILYRGYFKTSTVGLEQLQECGVTSNPTGIEGNQFCVERMELHPF